MKTWTDKLQDTYSSFNEWCDYSETYGLAQRLGFSDEVSAWEANPLIGGGVDPVDFGVVEK